MFARELPEGVQDIDHTLAVKDLVYLPELAAALGATETRRSMWPEHCVDPMLLAERDVVVVGGPDTNFWHGGAVRAGGPGVRHAGELGPAGLDMREPGDLPTYGSRMLTAQSCPGRPRCSRTAGRSGCSSTSGSTRHTR